MVISVVACCAVAVALSGAAEQHLPGAAHAPEHGGERGAATRRRQSLVPPLPLLLGCGRAPLDAGEPLGAPRGAGLGLPAPPRPAAHLGGGAGREITQHPPL